MKAFDLEQAKKGAAVVTRDGRDVRIIDFDYKCAYEPYKKYDSCIIAKIKEEDGGERAIVYLPNGKESDGGESPTDLMLDGLILSGWTNVYVRGEDKKYFMDDRIFDTAEQAYSLSYSDLQLVDTIKIKWEV